MYFYKIEAQIDANADDENTKDDNWEQRRFFRSVYTLHDQDDKEGTIIISSLHEEKLILGAIARNPDWLDKHMEAFLTATRLDCSSVTIKESTFTEFKCLINNSESDGYVFRENEVLIHFGLQALSHSSVISYNEYTIQKPLSKKKLLAYANDVLCADSLIPEIERIFQPSTETITGHPVHYFISCDNDYVCDKIYETLINALYINGRLSHRRYCVASMSDINSNRKECQALYEAFTGGAMVIKCGEKIEERMTAEERLLRAIFGKKFKGDDDDRDSDIYWLRTVCRTALKYRDKTLTIFCLPRTSERVKASMREHLDIMTLVEITEDYMSKERGKRFLIKTARKQKIKADKSLYRVLDSEQETFSSSELLRAYDVWHSRHLKTVSYPQYASFLSSGQTAAKTACVGSGFAELDRLIGLNEAKTVIKQASDYFKAQKIFRDRGMNSEHPSMHMVFTGSPGTAKTTVARLFARIMQESELLSVGRLYEVGRSDLVGKYVGWTAQKVSSLFNEAMGSVLLIDEAYSLVDSSEGDYGDEAISTIVAEMENRREDIVVIFAGYCEKMERFLHKNPGLRSRIAFHVPFADYDSQEMYSILEYIAETQSMIIDENVRDKVLPIFTTASREQDFGNGRFVRNLFERARMKQASRLLAMDIDRVTTNQIKRLIADDFEAPMTARQTMQRIGFYVA